MKKDFECFGLTNDKKYEMDQVNAKQKRQRRFLLILILLTVAVIWGHSMMPRAVSSAESGRFVDLLSKLWAFLGINDDMADHIVRKCAHFIEYALLGGQLCLYRLLGAGRSIREAEPAAGMDQNPVIRSAVIALFVALTDETIQIFSGRGSRVQDVWLDLCGAGAGAWILYGIWRNLRNDDTRH